MTYFLNKFKIFLKRPGQYFRYKQKFLRQLYFHFSRLMHFKTSYSRVYKQNFPKFKVIYSELIEKNEGFKLINSAKLYEKNINIDQVLKKNENDIKKIDIREFNNSDDGIINLKSSKDFEIESPEIKFVTNEYLIEIVSRYLKCIPILTNLSLWYSPNNRFFDNSSQVYHLDHEDYKQVKGFLYLNEVDTETGPLNIINALQSDKIQKLINYQMTGSGKRVNDKTIQVLKKKIEINENIMTGNQGDLLLCDTSSCFHFGSRLGSKPRLILAFQYTTPFSFSMDWNWKNSEIIPYKKYEFKSNLLVSKVLGNKI